MRPILGLCQGQLGARRWRQALSAGNSGFPDGYYPKHPRLGIESSTRGAVQGVVLGLHGEYGASRRPPVQAVRSYRRYHFVRSGTAYSYYFSETEG